MSQIASQQTDLLQQLKTIANKLDAMKHSERSAFVETTAQHLGISRSTLYSWLKKKVGWSSGRKNATTPVPHR